MVKVGDVVMCVYCNELDVVCDNTILPGGIAIVEEVDENHLMLNDGYLEGFAYPLGLISVFAEDFEVLE